jgi:hypothetical protein
MGIQQICQTITNFFNNVRSPFPQLSRLLLVCSMIRRPGLSVIQSTANIVKDLNKLGIPTGPMPNGSANMTVGVMFASTKEIYRAMKQDASVQVGFQPGSMMVTAFGGNAGGPITVQGMNMSAGMGFGDIN